MLHLLMEASVRSMALFAAVWLLLKTIRLRDLRTEKLIWTTVVLVSLAMPVLIQNFAVQVPARALPLQVVGRWEVLIGAQSHRLGIEQPLWAAYLLVTGILLARFARGLWLAGRLRRTAQRIFIDWAEPVDVRVTSHVRTPSSFGTTILLPAEWESWDPAQLRAVIAHESAHIRAHDCYRLWLITLYRAFFWFNPCAIWLRHRLTVLAELLSDEAAVAATGNRNGYAQILISLSAQAPMPTVTMGMALPATLTPRLKRLLESDMSNRNLRSSHKTTLLSAIGLTAAATAFGTPAPLALTGVQDTAVSMDSGQPNADLYPQALQKKHVEGQVVCRVTIDATGRVTKVVAVKPVPSHPELTVAAVHAVRSFHFNNTLSRPVIKTLAVKFELH